jgi:hypothetical protein
MKPAPIVATMATTTSQTKGVLNLRIVFMMEPV